MSKINRTIWWLSLLLAACSGPAEQQPKKAAATAPSWKTQVSQTLELFGHRNWIVIADAAYPQQSNPAIKTIKIDADHLAAVAYLSQLIEKAPHVNANIFLDKEMAYVPEKDAKGIDAYKTKLHALLEGKAVKTNLHEAIISELDAAAKLFNVLIIKTDLTLPYTSVFFQLDCGYWDSQAEEKLRTSILAQ